jgi:O-antigen/teichoic acid export membrane protein
MIGYIFAIITTVFLITITITSHYLSILNSNQVKTLWISTILMIILLGYVRSTVLNLEPISLYIFMPAGLYTVWYILTKSSANMINKDSETGIIRDTSF